MSLLRHRKIYSDVPRSSRWDRLPIPASHRNEFSAGYSLASCTPALLASALPASLILNELIRFVDIISANGKPSPFGLYQPRDPLHRRFPLPLLRGYPRNAPKNAKGASPLARQGHGLTAFRSPTHFPSETGCALRGPPKIAASSNANPCLCYPHPRREAGVHAQA
jgi:hypothetical protein